MLAIRFLPPLPPASDLSATDVAVHMHAAEGTRGGGGWYPLRAVAAGRSTCNSGSKKKDNMGYAASPSPHRTIPLTLPTFCGCLPVSAKVHPTNGSCEARRNPRVKILALELSLLQQMQAYCCCTRTPGITKAYLPPVPPATPIRPGGPRCVSGRTGAFGIQHSVIFHHAH